MAALRSVLLSTGGRTRSRSILQCWPPKSFPLPFQRARSEHDVDVPLSLLTLGTDPYAKQIDHRPFRSVEDHPDGLDGAGYSGNVELGFLIRMGHHGMVFGRP